MSSESKSAPTPARSTSPPDDAASPKGSATGSVNGSAPGSAHGSNNGGNGGGANVPNGGPAAPPAPAATAASAARPPLRSNFDLEPNPFEQSFSTSHSSTSLTSHATEKDDNKRSTSPKPLLPPLAAITSSETPFGWSTGLNSLRSGPLSPAMLTGPQQGSTGLTPFTSDHHSSFGRTGLTPGTGLTPLIGGPSSFPPPSPNTAAFLAMVTNGSSAAAMSSAVSATITPNTLAAITGAIQSSLPTSNHPPHPLSVSHVPPQPATFDPTNQRSSPSESSTSYFQQQPHHQHQQQANGDMYAASAGSAAANAANALYLLSQQHKEITDRAEAAGNAQAAKRGSKRKSMDGPPPPSPPATRAKKSRAAKGRSRSKKDDSPDFSDESDDDMPEPPSKSSKKPETEEEKRKNFLERNRQAALKCRQRKKAWLAQLQQKVEFLAAENERLTSALVGSREEIARLNNLVVQAGGQPNANSNGNPSSGIPPPQPGGPVSVPQHHSHHHLASQPASVSVGGGGSNQRGYGY